MCIAYLMSKGSHGIDDTFLIKAAVIPLVLGWGLAWCFESRPKNLASLDPSAPSDPRIDGSAKLSPTKASSSSRWLARSFDLSLFTSAVAFPSVVAVDLLLPSLWASVLANALWVIPAVLVVYSAAALWIESEFYRRFQTTPGKGLLAIRVYDRDGLPLTPEAYRQRNFRLFGAGLGFCVPPLTFLAHVLSARLLAANGYTKYDQTWGHVVLQETLTGRRAFGFIAASILLAAVTTSFNVGQSVFLKTALSANPSDPSLTLHDFQGQPRTAAADVAANSTLTGIAPDGPQADGNPSDTKDDIEDQPLEFRPVLAGFSTRESPARHDWNPDDYAFGAKVLRRLPEHDLGVPLHSLDATLEAAAFEGDPVFKRWHDSVGGTKVRVRYVGAHEFAEADQSWAARETTLSWALVFETTPVGVGKFTCESCNPTISVVAVDVDKDGNASVRVPFQALGAYGNHGTYPLEAGAIERTSISPTLSMLTVHDISASHGTMSASMHLFRIENSKFVEALNLTYWSDSTRAESCRTLTAGGKCGVYEPRVKWIAEPGVPYWSLSVDEAAVPNAAGANSIPPRAESIWRFNGSSFMPANSAAT